jgi:hypothetical protein
VQNDEHRLALRDEPVGGLVRVLPPQCHPAHDDLVRRDAELGAQDRRIVGDGRLRAGVQVVRAGGDHDVFEKHPEVEPAALAEVAVDREHQSDRGSEEGVVAPVLAQRALAVAPGDARQGVEVPADLAPALDVRRAPRDGVVLVLPRIGRAAEMGGAERRLQPVERRARDGVHPPGLDIGPAGRPARDLEDPLDGGARDGLVREAADAAAARDRPLDRVADAIPIHRTLLGKAPSIQDRPAIAE